MRLLGFDATWVGIGTFLTGIGLLLSGWAAWRLSRKNGKHPKQEEE